MVGFLLWLLLLMVCWPIALVAIVLYPIVWLLLLPFRIAGIAVEERCLLFRRSFSCLSACFVLSKFGGRQSCEGGCRTQASIGVAFEGLDDETPEIGGLHTIPFFPCEGRNRRVEEGGGEALRLWRECAAGELAVVDTEQAIAHGMEVCGVAIEGATALQAVEQVGQPAHEADHPQAEVGDGQPYFAGSGHVEDCEEKAEDGVVGIVIGEGFFEDFGVEGQGGEAGVVDWLAHGGVEDFAEIEADEILFRFFDEGGADVGHRLECASESSARLGG